MKLCVLGGCGARSAFLTKSLATQARRIQVDHIVLMDVDQQRLDTYGELARHIANRVNPELQLDLTLDAREAMMDADYIITTIRAGGDEARAFDEKICMEHGVLGQETTGAGGFAMALRSLPVLRDYCAIAAQVAKPGHIIFNFTNPSGIVTQGLRDLGYSNVYGICDAPSGFHRQLARIIGRNEEDVEMTCYGLNHLSWFREIRVDGKDVTDALLANPELYRKSEMRLFSPETIETLGGVMPNEYLYFYYDRIRVLQSIRGSGVPRGQYIAQVNAALEQELAEMDVKQEPERAFEAYMRHYAMRENAYFSAESGQKRPETMEAVSLEDFLAQEDAGGYAAVALQFILAITEGRKTRMVLSVPNQGAIDGIADDDIVEIICTIDRDGTHPLPIGKIDEMQLIQMRAIKYFERGAVKAALEGDRAAAVRAMYIHPLVNDLSVARELAQIFFERYHIDRS